MAPPDLPGYYFDPERNKYFKLPVQRLGDGGEVPDRTTEVPNESHFLNRRRKFFRTAASYANSVLHLLEERERFGVCGNFFQQQYMEAQCMRPQIWEYSNLGPGVIADIEQLCVDAMGMEGSSPMNVLLTCSKMGNINLWEVLPSSALHHPDNKDKLRSRDAVNQWSSQSQISHKGEPVLLSIPASIGLQTTATAARRLRLNPNLAVYKPQLEMWTVECGPDGASVSVGTNSGAALISLEGGGMQGLCRGDTVLAQEFDKRGNIISCGFRKGFVYDLDKRAATQHVKKMDEAAKMDMGSPICSIVGLESNEYHLLVASMNGQIKRWDRRNTNNSVGSFEGNVNSSSMLQLGVDQGETLLFSGGEDNTVRIWSLASGQLLCRKKVPAGTVLSIRRPIFSGWNDSEIKHRNFVVDHCWALWMCAGCTPHGLLYMHGFAG